MSWAKAHGRTPSLPTELIREVIGRLSEEGGVECLRRASLAARVLRGPCQEILFSTVVLDQIYSTSKESKCYRLLDALTTSTQLCGYVKTVIVRDGSKINFEASLKKRQLDGNIAALIYLLSEQQLEAVKFTGWRGETTTEFHDAALRLIGCPTLTTLKLDFLRTDILRAAGSTHIKHLGLTNMYENRLARGSNPLGRGVPPKKRPPTIHLTQLLVTEERGEISALLDPANHIYVGGVKNLHINVTPEPFRPEGDIAALLTASATSLQRLRFDASEWAV